MRIWSVARYERIVRLNDELTVKMEPFCTSIEYEKLSPEKTEEGEGERSEGAHNGSATCKYS